MGITKIVDFIRGLDKLDEWPGWIWIAVAFVISIALALGFEINIIGGFFKELPAFQGSDKLDGVVGQVLTGVGLAGASSYWHHRMALAHAQTEEAAPLVMPTGTKGTTVK
jgi:hypothetical protein